MEFARHGHNAWLVEPDSVEALVSGLERLLRDAPLRSLLAAGALSLAAGRDWGRIYDGLLAEYGKATTAAAAA
jgi:glycosyltransferase involved in cell wall biosynthesis